MAITETVVVELHDAYRIVDTGEAWRLQKRRSDGWPQESGWLDQKDFTQRDAMTDHLAQHGFAGVYSALAELPDTYGG